MALERYTISIYNRIKGLRKHKDVVRISQNALREKYRYYDQIQRFRLIDDTFMSVVFQDIDCTQFLIRTLLQDDGLSVTEVETQNSLKNLRGRSVRLDITAHDKTGKIYNIEVQRKDAGALPKRARYNSAMLDANVTKPGDELENLPETYVIFITENDYFQKKLPLYHVDRTIRELSEQFQDEAHIIYVNGQYRGNDPIGSVMHDFFCADPKDMNNQILADEVVKYKDTDKGVSSMCRIMEELTNESLKEGLAKGRAEGRLTNLLENVKKLMARGMSFDEVADVLELDSDDRKFVQDNL